MTFSWELRKFDDLFDTIANITLSRAELTADTGAGRDIHYGDILVKLGECLRDVSELPFITSAQAVQSLYQGDSGHARVKMVADLDSHILDDDRVITVRRFENLFRGQRAEIVLGQPHHQEVPSDDVIHLPVLITERPVRRQAGELAFLIADQTNRVFIGVHDLNVAAVRVRPGQQRGNNPKL